jgi:hypothetical protein
MYVLVGKESKCYKVHEEISEILPLLIGRFSLSYSVLFVCARMVV